MLNKEENELLCRVGPGTIMGDLMREYWLPILYSWELAPDGAPLRVRLLGEDLIAFRATDGALGLMAANCPHRGASLFFGRNEECGIRCVYHGWKFDTTGQCVDMPSEPAESNFKTKIKATAYHAREQGGVIFAYLGTRQADPPGLPQFEWTSLPETQVHHQGKWVLNCNYMQAMEGDLDSAHVFLLHSRLREEDSPALGLYYRDNSPRLEVQETEYGAMYAARRVEDAEHTYWRTTQYLMPVFTIFPTFPNGVVPSQMWVPIDDEHSLIWDVWWNPLREMPERGLLARSEKIEGMGHMRAEQTGKFFAHWWPQANLDNDFLQDREVQRTKTFTGMPSIRIQDAAMMVSMGPIRDRSQEHLGTTDAMVIKVRQRLLRAAKALRTSGILPPAADQPELYRLRSCAAVLPADVDWREALDDWHKARANEVLAATTIAP